MTPPSLAQPVLPAEPSAEETPQLPPSGPPSPPPWSDADAFSSYPNWIICWKCCKRSYVFCWYSHCFMCHMNETRT
jgi:hypothetical protein